MISSVGSRERNGRLCHQAKATFVGAEHSYFYSYPSLKGEDW